MLNSELFSLLFLFIILFLVLVIFVRIALRIRKNGGSLTTTLFAATYEFYNKDQRNAIEVISEQKAGKKMEEQASDEPQE